MKLARLVLAAAVFFANLSVAHADPLSGTMSGQPWTPMTANISVDGMFFFSDRVSADPCKPEHGAQRTLQGQIYPVEVGTYSSQDSWTFMHYYLGGGFGHYGIGQMKITLVTPNKIKGILFAFGGTSAAENNIQGEFSATICGL